MTFGRSGRIASAPMPQARRGRPIWLGVLAFRSRLNLRCVEVNAQQACGATAFARFAADNEKCLPNCGSRSGAKRGGGGSCLTFKPHKDLAQCEGHSGALSGNENFYSRPHQCGGV
jgi:hypothetical protein